MPQTRDPRMWRSIQNERRAFCDSTGDRLHRLDQETCPSAHTAHHHCWCLLHWRTHAAENRLDPIYALVVIITFRDEFHTVPVARAVLHEASNPDRLSRVWRRKLDNHLGIDRQFGPGKYGHPAIVEFRTAALHDGDFGHTLNDHSDGDIHFISRPPPLAGVFRLRNNNLN